MVLEVVKPGWVDGESFPIFSVDVHPSGTKFATGGQGSDCGRIVIWNLEPIRHKKLENDPKVPKQLCQMENHLACVNCVRWSSDGKYLASAGDDKLVMLWTRSMYGGGAVFGGGGKVNHESYKCVHTLRQHDGDVLDLAWSPEDKWLASCSVDNTVIIWDVSGGNPHSVAVLRGHTSHVKGVTWDPVGKYLASQSADKTLRVWRTGDWREETLVKEPFQDCGGTTHVLRLNWSPDGQYLVSAHAMNGGGPTAQIIERDGFKYEKDFVGHRKAVTCVRFNGNIFSRTTSKGKNNNYVCVAIGSRDRSISVWLTSLQRPLVVCHDLFDSSILDLAWTKDGMTLIACSMDGHIVGLNFSPDDLGTPLPVSEKHRLFKTLYGQTSGVAVSDKPVLIENAALLQLNEDSDALVDFPESYTDKSVNGTPIKGPTDKQIEVKTSDGRRRITPMFIVPTTDGDWSRNSVSSDSFGKLLSSSSSSEAKSKIKIERREGVVKPNVSPGKNSTPEKKEEPPKPSMIQIKRKVGTTMVPVTSSMMSSSTSSTTTSTKSITSSNGPTTVSTPAVNGTAAPTAKPAASTGDAPKAQSAVTTSKEDKDKEDEKTKKVDKNEDEKIKGKKPSNRIESSSESSDSDSGSSDSDSSDSTADETASQTEKSGKSDYEDKSKKSSSSLKNSVVGSKRKGDDISSLHPAKKRGRPPGTYKSKDADSGISTPISKSVPEPVASPVVTAAPAPQQLQAQPQQRMPPSPMRTPGLPPLSIPRNPYYVQLRTTEKIFHINIENEHEKFVGGSLHRVAVHTSESTSSPILWEALFTSPLAGATSGGPLLLFACRDATLHLFNPDGSRALPTLTLPSPAHRLRNEDNLVTCVTTGGRIFVWNMASLPPKSILKNVEISPLNRHTSPRTSVSISSIKFSADSMPILSISDGSSHIYSDDLGCWMQLTHSRQALSLSTAMSKGPPCSLPLASLTAVPTGMSKLNATVSGTWTASVIETKITASLFLKSPQEYKYWLLRLVKQLASQGQEVRLRSILDDLIASGSKVGSIGSNAESIGLKKNELLKSVLPMVGSNLALQRLYSEYSYQSEISSNGTADLFAD